MHSKIPVVVDANVIVSLLIGKGSKHELFFSEHITACSPEFVLFELGKYWQRIEKGSGLSEDELERSFNEVRRHMKTFPLGDIQQWLDESKNFSPDKDDAEYFALALKLNCPLWSEDKLLRKQSRVEVLSTPELLSKLGLK